MILVTLVVAGNAPKTVQLDTTTGFRLSNLISKSGIGSNGVEFKVNGRTISMSDSIPGSQDDARLDTVTVVGAKLYKGNQVTVTIVSAGNTPMTYPCDHGWTLKTLLEQATGMYANLRTIANLSNNGAEISFKYNGSELALTAVVPINEGGSNSLIIAKMYKGNE